VTLPVVLAVTLAAVAGGQVEFIVVHVHVELDVLGLVRLPTVAAPVAMTLLAAAVAMALLAASVAMVLLAAPLAMALLAASVAMTLLASSVTIGLLAAVVLLPGVLGCRLAGAGAGHHHLVPSGDLYVCDDLAGAGAEPVGDLFGIERSGHRHHVVLLVVRDHLDVFSVWLIKDILSQYSMEWIKKSLCYSLLC
jgi:hypothetical protein